MHLLFIVFRRSNIIVVVADFMGTWHGNADTVLTVEKLRNDAIEAGNLILERTAESFIIDRKSWRDIYPVLLLQMKSNIFCVTNTVRLQFFNKTFAFVIKEIKRRDYTEVIDDLESKLQSLNLDQSQLFYMISKRTKLELNFDDGDNDNVNRKEQQFSKMSLIGGLSSVIKELKDAIDVAFGNAAAISGFQTARSALIFGHPGSGKSLLCDALAEDSDATVIRINASEIFSKYFGETEANLLTHFDKAFKNYPNPTIVIIDEILNICPKDTKEDSAKRIHAAFLNVLDSVHTRKDGSRMFVIATTNSIENISAAVRRYGRLDMEIEIPVPDPISREDILTKHLSRLRHELSSDDIKTIAENCHGYIGADLLNLVAKAAMHAVNQRRNAGHTDAGPTLQLADVQAVYPQVSPSAMKEVLVKCPNVKWSDIGGQDELKLQLKQSIEWPLKHPEKFLRMGINPPRGILMFGPPGCSKTMIAKALATESNVNFLSVKGPELFSMYVGESERAVRELFRKARQVAPTIIFFDEIDALGSERSNSSGGGSSVKERVLAQMLTEMDGVNALANVTIVAATNRPDMIDKALMRPGRLDRIVYVKLPDAKTREEIFRIKLARMPLADDIELSDIVDFTEGYSGAEIQAICQEAALYALEECLDAETVQWKHFERALFSVKPRTSQELLRMYDEYSQQHLTQ